MMTTSRKRKNLHHSYMEKLRFVTHLISFLLCGLVFYQMIISSDIFYYSLIFDSFSAGILFSAITIKETKLILMSGLSSSSSVLISSGEIKRHLSLSRVYSITFVIVMVVFTLNIIVVCLVYGWYKTKPLVDSSMPGKKKKRFESRSQLLGDYVCLFDQKPE